MSRITKANADVLISIYNDAIAHYVATGQVSKYGYKETACALINDVLHETDSYKSFCWIVADGNGGTKVMPLDQAMAIESDDYRYFDRHYFV